MSRFLSGVIFLVVFCATQANPIITEKEYLDNEDIIDISFLGPGIYGYPSSKTGELVAKWTSDMERPEELGEYFESDILHPPTMNRGAGLKILSARWPNKTVPYVISAQFSSTNRALILSAMADFHSSTCVKFVPRTTQKDYVSIESSAAGCYSSVGRIGGKQVLNLQNPGCVSSKGTPIHELMHALGFIHEHTRPDRDDYVSIKWWNIEFSLSVYRNFMKQSSSTVSAFNTSYDYGSVMHYGNNYFTRNGADTIVPKVAGAVIGQRNGFSARDIQSVRAMYKCTEITTA